MVTAPQQVPAKADKTDPIAANTASKGNIFSFLNKKTKIVF